MSELARFFGIIIRMRFEPRARHHAPHFHAFYQGHLAAFGIDPVELLAGDFPRRSRRLVEAWAELHQEELRTAWDNLQSGSAPEKINPLQ